MSTDEAHEGYEDGRKGVSRPMEEITVPYLFGWEAGNADRERAADTSLRRE